MVGCTAGPSPLGEAFGGQAQAPGLEGQELGFEELLDVLGAPDRAWPEKQASWRRARAAGWEKSLLELFERRVRLEPQNAQAHVDLGNLLLLQVLEEAGASKRARLALAANEHYGRALELDPAHWEARFQKAVGLAHWPPILGRRREALSLLGQLMQDQERLPPQPRFAWTYLLLGTLQARLGRQTEAAETWRRGLERHPEEEALRTKLDSTTGEGGP